LQDDFRVSPTLMLNLGVRYEYSTPPIERQNRLANFDPAAGGMEFAKDGSLFERTLVHPDQNNWAPRVGFSYSPRSGWVVRGAYGVFYSHTVRQGREGMLGFNPPFLVDNTIVASVFGPTAVASAAVFRLADGYPQGLLVAHRTPASGLPTFNNSILGSSASWHRISCSTSPTSETRARNYRACETSTRRRL
jgi:hypothetical protein